MQNDNEEFKIKFQKRLIKFSLEVIKFCEEIRKNYNLRSIADQLIRSATSIGANIIEARACSSKADYLRFFQISLRSANETKYWLILISYSSQELKFKSEQLLKETKELASIIGAGVLTMKGKNRIKI